MGLSAQTIGQFSIAAGHHSSAEGTSSIAMGEWTDASGDYSTAMGNHTTASANGCTALGELTTASGYDSTALGELTTASGFASTAMGLYTIASGDYSTAMGSYASALNVGALVWGDGSTTLPVTSASDNSVTMRAAGGYQLFSDSGMTAGVSLAPDGTAWGTLSDRNAKKNFAEVDGIDILKKLATVPVQKWNYKWEDDSAVPNIGPMAQAFKAAFYPGRDDKSITTLEFDGVELAAIQGLNQKVDAESLKSEVRIQKLEAVNAELKARLEKLERLLNEESNGGAR